MLLRVLCVDGPWVSDVRTRRRWGVTLPNESRLPKGQPQRSIPIAERMSHWGAFGARIRSARVGQCGSLWSLLRTSALARVLTAVVGEVLEARKGSDNVYC